MSGTLNRSSAGRGGGQLPTPTPQRTLIIVLDVTRANPMPFPAFLSPWEACSVVIAPHDHYTVLPRSLEPQLVIRHGDVSQDTQGCL